MTTFEVTTALTVYTTYTVEASDRDVARVRVLMSRAELPSADSGDNADEKVIAVREVNR